MRYNLYYSIYHQKNQDQLLVSLILYKDKLKGIPWLKETIQIKCEPTDRGSHFNFIGLIEAFKWANHLISGHILLPENNSITIFITDKELHSSLSTGKFKKDTKPFVREIMHFYNNLSSKMDIYFSLIPKNQNISILYLRSDDTKRKLEKLSENGFKIKKQKRDISSLERWDVEI